MKFSWIVFKFKQLVRYVAVIGLWNGRKRSISVENQSISRNKDFFLSNKGTFCFLEALFWNPSEFRFRLFESFDVNAIDFDTAEGFKSDIAKARRSFRFDLFDFKSSFAKVYI